MSALVAAQGELSQRYAALFIALIFTCVFKTHGFISTGSKPALAMGMLISGLYAASGYFIPDRATASRGYAMAVLTSIALGGRMGHYYYK